MTRFTDRVTRDLHQIADRSTPSSTAWDSIRTRIDEQTDQPPTMEVIMLSPDRNDQPKRAWMLAAAAVAGLALVGGLVFATTRSDDTVPVNTPTTLPTEPAPDAEVTPEPLADPVTVTVTGTYADSDVAPATTPTPSSDGLIGDTTILGTTNFEGAFAGSAPFVSQTWNLPDGSQFATGEFVFTGAVEGLGSGTLSFVDLPEVVDGVWRSTATITGGTGDLEGAYGTGVFTADAVDPGNGGVGTYSWTITVPPKDSLETVTATGTAVYQGGFKQGDQPGEYVGTFRHIFEGSMVGEGPSEGTSWDIAGGQLGVLTMEFTGTIDDLGTGTMTMLEIYTRTSGSSKTSVTVTGGTGDFEGITGTGTWVARTPGEYTFELTAPAATQATAPSASPDAESAPDNELLVFEGTYASQASTFKTQPAASDGGAVPFVSSTEFSGDLIGQRAVVGTLTSEPGFTDGQPAGVAVFAVSSPELGEGLLVTQFEGESDRGKMSTTGDVIGLSGPFTGLVGTMTTTGSAGASARGTYVIELQPSAPSGTPTAPTESISIDYASTSTADSVWQLTDTEFGGATTFTGDVAGAATFRSNDSATTDDLSIVQVCACTLAGVGDGVFVTVLSSPVQGADGTVTWDAEFFGASGAFTGLRGTSTATTVTDDATGAFAPATTFDFELSR